MELRLLNVHHTHGRVPVSETFVPVGIQAPLVPDLTVGSEG